MKELVEKWKRNIDKKQRVLMIVAVTLIFILLVVTIVICLLPKQGDKPEGGGYEVKEADYTKTVTNADGTEFKASYEIGSEEDFVIRFPELKCEDNCSNISEVKLNNKLLTVGEDYEVKEGSVIIVLLNKLLNTLEPGQYDLTFKINEGGTVSLVGVKFSLKNEVCPENLVPKGGECIELMYNDEEESKKEDSANGVKGSGNENKTNTSNGSKKETTNPKKKDRNANTNSSSKNESEKQNNTSQIEKQEEAQQTTPTNTEPETPQEQTNTNEHTEEFNLNDGYKVEVLRVRWLKTNGDVNDCYTEEKLICPEIVFGYCAVKKDGIEVKKVYFGAGESLMTESQYLAKQQEATNNGYKMSEGYGIEPSLNEEYCSTCSLSCGRW